MKIEILGPGCPRCRDTQKRILNVLAKSGQDADVSHITDLKEIAKRGVMFTPAVAIDGEVKVAGKVPSEDEIRKLLGA
jgi:small redox-active disulfide protein 2